MELTLRAARKLESKIDKALAEIELDGKTSVRARAEVSEVFGNIGTHKASFIKSLEKKVSLVRIKFTIRRMIADANHSSGINNLLTKKAELESLNGIHKSISKLEATPSSEDIYDLLDIQKKKIDLGTSSSYIDNGAKISLSALDEEYLTSIKNILISHSKEIESIEDKLNELNFSSKITLSAFDERILKDLKLV